LSKIPKYSTIMRRREKIHMLKIWEIIILFITTIDYLIKIIKWIIKMI